MKNSLVWLDDSSASSKPALHDTRTLGSPLPCPEETMTTHKRHFFLGSLGSCCNASFLRLRKDLSQKVGAGGVLNVPKPKAGPYVERRKPWPGTGECKARLGDPGTWCKPRTSTSQLCSRGQLTPPWSLGCASGLPSWGAVKPGQQTTLYCLWPVDSRCSINLSFPSETQSPFVDDSIFLKDLKFHPP